MSRFPDLPDRMKRLPVDHRQFPVPWFVAWVDGEPQFPIADGEKYALAWRNRLCWVCGEKLGRFSSFVIGPMCAVNRTSSEPPSHRECAQFSARNCPFLTRPRMKRVGEENMPSGVRDPAGTMLARNPGVALVWTTLNPSVFKVANGTLFNIGDPQSVEWYAEGRAASRAEVMASIESGLPALEDMCRKDRDVEGAFEELERRKIDALTLVPA